MTRRPRLAATPRDPDPRTTGQKVFVLRDCTDNSEGRWECLFDGFTDVDGALDRLETKIKRVFNNIYDWYIFLDPQTGEPKIRKRVFSDEAAAPGDLTDFDQSVDFDSESGTPRQFLSGAQQAIDAGELELAAETLAELLSRAHSEITVLDIQELPVLVNP